MTSTDLSRDYGNAVLHLVWDIKRRTNERILLCGAVELLPHEVPPPIELPERHTELSRGHFLYAVDRVVPVSAALRWYELAKDGCAPRPNVAGGIDCEAALRFVAMGMDEEPKESAFCMADRSFPFAAGWHCCSRTRHLIARVFRIDQLWTPDELAAACRWLSDTIHFDFSETPEFWGAVHLIAPNPLFRSLLGRLDRTRNPLELVVRVDHRLGVEASALQYELDGIGPMGRVFAIRRRLASPIERIQLPSNPGQYHERVFDTDRGLLYQLGPFAFLESFNTTINLASETRHVSVLLADGSPGDFRVALRSDFQQSTVSGHSRQGSSAERRIRQESRTRELRQRGRTGQRWFRDQVADATRELRALVGAATARIWVADPYFSPDDMLRVLAAASDPRVPIQVLAGGEHLRSRNNKVELAEELASTINECKRTGRMNQVFVRVMSGSPPALHDRLLLADDDLWMLGSSLNAFGSRGTILLKVPDPEPILADLQRIWEEANDFSVWLARRRDARQASAGHGSAK